MSLRHPVFCYSGYPLPNPMSNIRRWMRVLRHWMHDTRNCISFYAYTIFCYIGYPVPNLTHCNVEYKDDTNNIPHHA